jgi:hypothetical protein
MRLDHWPIMQVTMMLVMDVAMLVLHRFVLVLMVVAFGQMKPKRREARPDRASTAPRQAEKYSRTCAYFSLAPFIGAVVALVLLHEAVTLQLVIAGLLMGPGRNSRDY